MVLENPLRDEEKERMQQNLEFDESMQKPHNNQCQTQVENISNPLKEHIISIKSIGQ